MAVYKCLLNGDLDEATRRAVEAGLAGVANEHLGIDPASVSVEFTVVPEGRWYTAGRPSTASMVLGSVPAGIGQETRVKVLEAMARSYCDITGADFHDVLVVAADARPPSSPPAA